MGRSDASAPPATHGSSEAPVEGRLELADASLRRAIVALAREARALEEQAVQHPEKALALTR